MKCWQGSYAGKYLDTTSIYTFFFPSLSVISQLFCTKGHYYLLVRNPGILLVICYNILWAFSYFFSEISTIYQTITVIKRNLKALTFFCYICRMRSVSSLYLFSEWKKLYYIINVVENFELESRNARYSLEESLFLVFGTTCSTPCEEFSTAISYGPYVKKLHTKFYDNWICF